MKNTLLTMLIFIGLSGNIAFGEYFKLDIVSNAPIVDIDPKSIESLMLFQDTMEPKVETEETIKQKQDIKNIKEERDIFAILFGTTSSGVLAFIGRIIYIWYKSKTGQIVVTKIKNDISELENDIIEKIAKITDLETGELAREKLRNIQKQLLLIAQEKLDPITETE